MQEKELENAPVRFGTNLGMILELHDMYQENPDSVSDEMRFLFENISSGQAGTAQSDIDHSKVKSLLRLIDNIRLFGHLESDIYPVYTPDVKNVPSLDFEDYNLTEDDLKRLPASLVSVHLGDYYDNAFEAVTQLHSLYTGPLAYEYMHINDTEERQWLKETIETQEEISLSDEEKKHLFKTLAKVEGFEKYLHKNFVGAKRFSIEGVDAIVPLLDHMLELMADEGIPNLQIGMAHRGRLNVLTHVLEKPYEMMISEFMHTDPMKFLPEDGSLEITQGWMKDVKYHLGGSKTREDKGLKQRISLANNPSHLEVVGPIVLGKTRAQQETTDHAGHPDQDFNKAIAAIVHGDAAFPGQGIVYETLNLGKLNGYSVGGSVHIIANNRIGFTTEETDARSTVYASDAALGFDLPILHVNADRPEHVLRTIEIALKYRQKFNKDIVIDVLGYRRYGHNEMDEPTTTNPLLYKEVKSHDTIDEIYGAKLVEENVISEDEKKETIQSVLDEMRAAHDKIDKGDTNVDGQLETPEVILEGQDNPEDGISRERLEQINEDLFQYPDSFTVFKKLSNVLERRKKPFEDDEELIDWAHAEALAFASINQDGTPIRLTGQDSERGTFAQRHAVLHDPETGEEHIPLHVVRDSNATFDVHNSPLSEAAVVGFDYGYNVEQKSVMAIWEAQYGDFSNMAQVIFDNFMAAGNAKWGETSGMTLFLPHAQEGQGAEHSSARLERYLQLAAENNMTVANLSSASNYFHLLRKQAKYLDTEKMRPLVLMTPKSLLRNQIVSEPVSAFTDSTFKEIILPEYKRTKVKKVLIASGKMAVDLLTEQRKNPDDEVMIIRLEQIYPFPSDKIQEVLKGLKSLDEVRFVQEEPENMGTYNYALPFLLEMVPEKVEVNYVGRIRRASPAEGDGESYKLIQQNIIETALKS
ncbi:2-oxoglutarate dehydrogenase E1 component [Salinicoccus sp. ID82-1]|uniref:oxoglutarate dehydrogenase (succinyl-transferring) n=1 Tax=Salinicoccus cyprini TaxID=2493691 RepID=A0A558AZ73_9STAP|nr:MULTISPECIES: 2-oxoglutarate dehydrogenase E1 component [Salinicoccus]MCG1009141.1 2-oxoglutarate dehydrogenase E1 component [Salinicoccus sp. ID82-1]TVT29585.1 2-oxoglutarate dehydrogenase E1 component [Salinicoccus cyprini]